MDLPSPVSQKSYERIMRKINLASREVADDSMKNAAKEEVSASGSTYLTLTGHTYFTTKHIQVNNSILIDFQVIHNERIHALAEPISGKKLISFLHFGHSYREALKLAYTILTYPSSPLCPGAQRNLS
ncbi:hypothetical protein TNCV_137941 [Trichonephila clavipes]|nr:hypothetical protein TNCV_137941 [Trichonephila clavipes]